MMKRCLQDFTRVKNIKNKLVLNTCQLNKTVIDLEYILNLVRLLSESLRSLNTISLIMTWLYDWLQLYSKCLYYIPVS